MKCFDAFLDYFKQMIKLLGACSSSASPMATAVKIHTDLLPIVTSTAYELFGSTDIVDLERP